MRTFERGAIVVESALVVGLVFLFLFGAVDIALVGYDQMTVDSASFTSAHLGAVRGNDAAGADAATSKIYSRVAAENITHAPAPAPSTNVPVDYGYNGTAAEQSASLNDRHGGASIMQPEEYQSTVQRQTLSVLGTPIRVAGSMLEPMWLENGIHFDVANEDYNAGAGDAAFQGNAFTQGENTPPYYVGYNLTRHCPDAQPWPQAPYTDCAGGQEYSNLGVAEHLDYSNWGSETPGADGSPGSATSVAQSTSGTTFAETSCHQKYYAVVAQYLSEAQPTHLNQLQKLQGSNYQPLSPGINNFNAWSTTGFPSDDTGINAAVRTIYSWDTIVQSVPPNNDASIDDPQFALNPGLGC